LSDIFVFVESKGGVFMLARNELRDIRWLLVAKLKEIDERILVSNDDEELQHLAEDRKEYEKLFQKIDNLMKKEKEGMIHTAAKIIELAC
jgi:hypothetical protein